MIRGMTTPVLNSEQKQVYVALSAFVSSMINSTEIRKSVANLPEVPSEDALNERRKYRPGPNSPVAPLDLGRI